MIREMVPAMRENNPVKCDSIIIDINININIDNEDESFRGFRERTGNSQCHMTQIHERLAP